VTIVLDSSATLAWIYADELTPGMERVFDYVVANHACVPALWRLEVANSLNMGVRRGRIEAAFRDAALTDLALLNITTDPHTNDFAWTATLRLADRFRLTLYDAAYLELAQRLACPLATLDQELRAAAGALKVPLWGAVGDAPGSARAT
jgi:predicted nucleic acid-binding protein